MPALPCPFHWLTGYPCPSCGGTRAVLALLQGDWQRALLLNPGLLLLLAGIAAYAAWGIVRHRRDGRWPHGPHIPAARWLALIALTANWAYLLHAGLV